MDWGPWGVGLGQDGSGVPAGHRGSCEKGIEVPKGWVGVPKGWVRVPRLGWGPRGLGWGLRG